jgi:restriction system protein
MAIPDYQTIMLPLLVLIGREPNKELPLPEAVSMLADQFKLTREERQRLFPSGGKTIFAGRVSWSAVYLKKAGLIEAVVRSRFRITERGLEALNLKPTKIDNRFLSQYAEFQQYYSRRNQRKEGAIQNTNRADDSMGPVGNRYTPRESIALEWTKLRDALAAEILDKLKKSSPEFFERLVVSLIVKMGYGGSLADAGDRIGRSHDGGIDGVIKQDRLGLDNVYLQAKRWSDKPVGSPDIDQFAGALSKRKAAKGIFITTSSFSKEAQTSVKDYGSKIVLLDGLQLAELMLDYNVGVLVEDRYEIKRVDSDFFEEELT